jgi:two-component system, response regulator PdtaR
MVLRALNSALQDLFLRLPVFHIDSVAQRTPKVRVRQGTGFIKGRVGGLMSALVLVVEDDFLVRMNAVFLLEEAGFDTLQAGTADEAIGLLETRSDIRVVFTDINMPGSMDGLALAHAVRRRWPPVGLLLTSGYARVRDEDVPARGLFLGKPYQPADLVRMVQSLTR